jgi:AcrR family transcriptional regulator
VTGRPRQFDDEAVFAAVTALATEGGAAAITLAAVAERLGVTGPAVRARFGSKHGLLTAYAAHQPTVVDEVFDRAVTESTESTGPTDAIVRALVSLAAGVGRRTAMANSLSLLHLDVTDDELRRHAARHARQMRRRVSRLVADAITAGELAPGDPDAIALALTTTYNGALIGWAIDGTGRLDRWLRSRLADHLALLAAPVHRT